MSLTRQEWISHQLKVFPDSREDVLAFISNVLYHESETPVEAIISLFESGYCYHFARILQDMFGGTLVWLEGYSHIVWTSDETPNIESTLYDINGVVHDYTPEQIKTIDALGDNLEWFLHR